VSDTQQLVAAIDSCLVEIAAEIAALDAARAQLAPSGTRSQARANTTDVTATRSRRRAARGRLTPSEEPPEPAIRSSEPEPVKAAQDVGSAVAPKRSTRKRASTVTRRRRGGGAVGTETLERLLADTSVGLSANAIAQQVGAGYNRTLKLLRELEAAGQVRRSGSRRSTVWRLITEEEHIAQRAAELERRMSAPSQRRGRARAS
jgi:hypothetical protein